MGQIVSSPREATQEEAVDQPRSRLSRRSLQRGDRRSARSRNLSRIPSITPVLDTLPTQIPASNDNAVSPQALATFSRQISAQSAPVTSEGQQNRQQSQNQDEIFYEHHEERPLRHMEDLGMRNAPITNITASPMPRRSRLPSLRSLFVPGPPHSISHPVSQESQIEGISQHPRSSFRSHGNRQSIFGSLLRRPAEEERSRDAGIISGPFPFQMGAAFPSEGGPSNVDRNQSRTMSSRMAPSVFQRSHRANRNSRFNRIRQSISMPVDMDDSLAHWDDGDLAPPSLPRSRLSLSLHEQWQPTTDPRSSPNSLDQLNVVNPVTATLNASQRTEDTPDSSHQNIERPRALNPSPLGQPRLRREGHFNEQITPTPRVSSGNISRLGQDSSLPRLLSLAALAIASRLSGSSTPSSQDLQTLAPNNLEESLQNLFRLIQNSESQEGESSGSQTNGDTDRPSNAPSPNNFLRVFRVANNTPNPGNAVDASRLESLNESTDNEDHTRPNDQREDPDNRTVTLLVVGVRSVASNDTVRQERAFMDESPRSLQNLWSRSPPTRLNDQASITPSRHASSRSNFPYRRRSSSGTNDALSLPSYNQRNQSFANPGRSTPIAPNAVYDPPDSVSPLPLGFSESPPGPHPPPSTPADPSLSSYSSGTSTPVRRPTSASAVQQALLANSGTSTRFPGENSIASMTDRPMPDVRHRRRSDSEFARHRDLGAGAARRNGVVGPDDAESSTSSASGIRSWLIYVVGTNLSEDHPALNAPSLFTDNPSYEDMLLLSSLLGPAKPPVATREDVESADGVFVVQMSGDDLTARESTGSQIIPLGLAAKCLVCLEDYQVEDELRQLRKCSHYFHKDCIDEWLIAGRNSCPLCRTQGVDEKSNP